MLLPSFRWFLSSSSLLRHLVFVSNGKDPWDPQDKRLPLGAMTFLFCWAHAILFLGVCLAGQECLGRVETPIMDHSRMARSMRKSIERWANWGVLGEPRRCCDVVLNRVSPLVKRMDSTTPSFLFFSFFFPECVSSRRSTLSVSYQRWTGEIFR